MFSFLDRPTRLCDGISRREWFRAGGSGVLGLSLADVLRAREQQPPAGIVDDPTFGRAKNLIYVWLQGGPPQHETFDPKPEAPAEIRGPFKAIRTNVPGIDFCELLPRTARIADKLAVVRSLATDNNVHSQSGYEVLTGYDYRGPNARRISPTDWPYFGSLVKLLKPSETLPPLSSVWLPRRMHLNENVQPAGQTAGFLGRQWDPDLFEIDPSQEEAEVEGLELNTVPLERLQKRTTLLERLQTGFRQLERGRAVQTYDAFQQQALDLLVSGKVQKAFDVAAEPAKLRDRYGRMKWGQTLLLARRLVEAGARMVHVNWCREPGDSAVDNPMWDTHALNADRVEDVLCPMFDVGFTALIEDLDQRGMLDETLVVAVGEFGRTPKINAKGGRDHWGNVFSFAMAGAGVQTAQVYGASDRNGGHPARDRVSAGDLTATIFHLLGIRHDGTFHDPQRREHRLTQGQPIRALLGGGVATADRINSTGNVDRVPPYDASLLLNTDFAANVPLLPADHGSRPKGWRAAPVHSPTSDALAVRTVSSNKVAKGETPHARLGFGLKRPSGEEFTVPKGAAAILAQEMRSPRLGRFTFSADVCGQAASEEALERLFAKLVCRLVIYRYSELSKDPRQRQEFVSLPFAPKFAPPGQPRPETVTVEKVLDSTKPGQNFPIGKGFGVAVIVENTAGELTVPAGTGAWLRVERVRLEFDSRVIDEEVQV